MSTLVRKLQHKRQYFLFLIIKINKKPKTRWSLSRSNSVTVSKKHWPESWLARLLGSLCKFQTDRTQDVFFHAQRTREAEIKKLISKSSLKQCPKTNQGGQFTHLTSCRKASTRRRLYSSNTFLMAAPRDNNSPTLTTCSKWNPKSSRTRPLMSMTNAILREPSS